jgi:hypothetical protein
MRTLIARAWMKMAKLGQRYRMCLVVSPRRSLYMEPDGTSQWTNGTPASGAKLQMRRVNYRGFGGHIRAKQGVGSAVIPKEQSD